MNKKYLVVAVVLVIVAVAAVLIMNFQTDQSVETNIVDAPADDLNKQATQGAMPSIDPKSNPMENAPDINPVSNTNPFSDIKTNPFN